MELDPFENAARTDALRLRHWKKNKDKNTTYTFARFNNKTVRILSYSDSEYATVLHSTPRGRRRRRTRCLKSAASLTCAGR